MIAEKYGRKSGLLRHLQALALLYTGQLRAFTGPAPRLPKGRTIFVCKGNIARSAYAAARARMMGFSEVESAGVRAGTDRPAHPDAIRAAALRGVSLEAHRSRHVAELNLRPEDRVFVFEIGQARLLARHYAARVFLLGAWSKPPRPHLEDPFNRLPAYYAECFGNIDRALQALRAEDRSGLGTAIRRRIGGSWRDRLQHVASFWL